MIIICYIINIKKKLFCDIENTTNNIIEDTNDYILMEIPFVKNLNTYLYKLHLKTCHRSLDYFRKYLLNQKIFYKGIINDLKRTINNCSICQIKNKKIDLKKKDKYNLIIFHNPKDRYIADITYIPKDFVNNSENVNYLNTFNLLYYPILKYNYYNSMVNYNF